MNTIEANTSNLSLYTYVCMCMQICMFIYSICVHKLNKKTTHNIV